jgi:plastocyanin
MATRKRQLAAALLLGAVLALQSAAGSSAEGPTVEASSAGAGFTWKPSTASVGIGGTVGFKNPSSVVPHGVNWTGGPEKPSCSGVPAGQESVDWSGSCTFAQSGTYTFVCPVHPTEMKGTISVVSGEAPPGTPPPPEGSPESPLQGSASSAVKVAKSQRGSSVRGSVDLSPASVGGRLEVTLLARRASLFAAQRPATSRVGRLVRSPSTAGRLAFTVTLKRAARKALRIKKKLSLTVQVVVTPPGRAALTLKRGVILHV